MLRMSPRNIFVFGRIGIDVATAPRVIFRRKTPRAPGCCAISASVFPSSSFLVTQTSIPSTGTLKSSRSSTSSMVAGPPIVVPSRPPETAANFARSPIIFTRTSRAPTTATTSPSRNTVSAAASSMTPLRRRRSTKTRALGTSASASAARRPLTLLFACTRNARTSHRCHAVPAPPSSLVPPCFSS